MSLDEIKEAIKDLNAQEKQQLLLDLPELLQIPRDKLAWMKLAESSFDF